MKGTVLTLSYPVNRVHPPLPSIFPRPATIVQGTSSTSSADIECMIENLFDDDYNSVIRCLPAAISVVVTEQQVRPYPGNKSSCAPLPPHFQPRVGEDSGPRIQYLPGAEYAGLF